MKVTLNELLDAKQVALIADSEIDRYGDRIKRRSEKNKPSMSVNSRFAFNLAAHKGRQKLAGAHEIPVAHG